MRIFSTQDVNCLLYLREICADDTKAVGRRCNARSWGFSCSELLCNVNDICRRLLITSSYSVNNTSIAFEMFTFTYFIFRKPAKGTYCSVQNEQDKHSKSSNTENRTLNKTRYIDLHHTHLTSKVECHFLWRTNERVDLLGISREGIIE